MPEYSDLFVVLLGLGTVFAGLLCIILLITVMSWLCSRTAPKAAAPAPAAPKSAPAAIPRTAAPVSVVTPPMMAAISAAIAEDMGTDVSAIRIVSMKKV